MRVHPWLVLLWGAFPGWPENEVPILAGDKQRDVIILFSPASGGKSKMQGWCKLKNPIILRIRRLLSDARGGILWTVWSDDFGSFWVISDGSGLVEVQKEPKG
jgi:hypothetical protein